MKEKGKNNTNFYLLFTGHMFDKPGRPNPRFPASKEEAVRKQIREKAEEAKSNQPPECLLRGIAGGACGGDILFRELCSELSIPTQLYLDLPEEKYLAESFAFAGSGWINRFGRLYDKLPHIFLSEY